MKIMWEWRYKLHTFLALAPQEVSGQLHSGKEVLI